MTRRIHHQKKRAVLLVLMSVLVNMFTGCAGGGGGCLSGNITMGLDPNTLAALGQLKGMLTGGGGSSSTPAASSTPASSTTSSPAAGAAPSSECDALAREYVDTLKSVEGLVKAGKLVEAQTAGNKIKELVLKRKNCPELKL